MKFAMRYVLALSLVFIVAPFASAVAIVGEVTVPANGYDGFATYAELRVAAPGNFTADFSALGAEPFSVTWKAPAGKQIEIAMPLGFSSGGLPIEWFVPGGGFGFDLFEDTSPTIVADFDVLPALDGSAIALAGPSTGGDNAGATAYYLPLTPGQTYRLTSLTLSTTVPAAYDEVFDDAIVDFRIRSDAEASTTGLADPGQWIRLVDDPGAAIPEPASLSLLGLGGLLALRRRRS